LKPIAFLLILILFFASCKPTATIITSKNEAVKKGIYSTPIPKKISAKKEVIQKNESKKDSFKSDKIKEVEESDYATHSTDTSYLAEQLINSATNKIGAKYKSGGTTDEGFDCSGLMYHIFNMYNINLPRSSFEQAKLGVVITRENSKKGDLIFFKTNGRSQINHVGMITEISEEEIKFIHSSTSSGVIISSTKEPYYQKNFVQINRLIE
jgi:murein DD-endopeptidase / murein LD-carboxypeptidase